MNKRYFTVITSFISDKSIHNIMKKYIFFSVIIINNNYCKIDDMYCISTTFYFLIIKMCLCAENISNTALLFQKRNS